MNVKVSFSKLYLQILFGVITGAMNLGLATPHLEAFAMARGAAPSVFAIMDRKPTIDSLSEDGIKLEKIEGNIQFNNVHFNYPNRPSVKVSNIFKAFVSYSCIYLLKLFSKK